MKTYKINEILVKNKVYLHLSTSNPIEKGEIRKLFFGRIIKH